jgi:Ca-activated chloride channel homolog
MKFFLSSVLTLLFAFSIYAQAQAEITVPSTFLRKSPSPTAEKVQSLQRGEKLVLEKTQDTNGWYYVSTLNGKVKGWIHGNTFHTTIGAETQATSQPISEPMRTNSQIAAQPQQMTGETVGTAAQASAQKAVTTASSVAETPKEDDEVLRIATEEVSLNVRVIDENKRPVSNLNQTHFQVYEDNVLQPITSLTTAEVPTNYALLVDNSRSLRSQLDKVAEAGKIIVGMNRASDESTVVRFVSTDKIEVIQDFTTDGKRLNEALDSLFIEGGQTAIIDAIYLTANRVNQYQNSRKKDDLKRRALILVSDGDDRGSTHNQQQLFDLLRASDVQIYAIGFVNDLKNEPDSNGVNRQEKARTFLSKLAEETGGKVYFPGSIDELSQIANDISRELRTQYLITYSPTNEKGGKTFRNIKVVVADGTNKEKRTAVTRSGRTAQPEEKASQPVRQNQTQKP